MASQLASGDLVSDRYASALYELAAEKKLVDSVLNDLSNLKNIMKDNKELSLVVKSPLISSSDKQNIFETLLKKINANELTNTFIKVIEKNKRFSNLASIITQFININSQKRGDVIADITSADELNDDQKSNIMEQIPAGRMGMATEIASAALYLASNEASYVTGATLHVNGGMVMV